MKKPEVLEVIDYKKIRDIYENPVSNRDIGNSYERYGILKSGLFISVSTTLD